MLSFQGTVHLFLFILSVGQLDPRLVRLFVVMLFPVRFTLSWVNGAVVSSVGGGQIGVALQLQVAMTLCLIKRV